MKRIALMVLLAIGAATTAQAGEWYANMGMGVSLFERTTQNGTWFQEGQPYKMNLTDLAGKLGVGYRFSPEWSIEVNGISFGRATSAGKAVPDEWYEPEHHKPKHGAPAPNHFDARQRSYGGEIVAVRSFPWGEFRPYVKGGAFAAYNDMPYTIIDVPSGQVFDASYKGYTVGLVGGAGIGWKWAYVDFNYYRGLGTLNYPITKSDKMIIVGIQVPF